MPVEKELAGLTPTRPTVLTVGVFDGVHIGHQKLLAELITQAQQRNLVSCVITFRQHPASLLSPRETPPNIVSLPEKIRLIKAAGVDLVLTLNFDIELAQIEAQTFVLLLQHYLKMEGLVLGWDFAMGRHRSGNIAAVEFLGRQLKFSTMVVPPVTIEGEIVSSTAIRQALAKGGMAKVNAMLGRRFSLEGRVVTGEGRGLGLGFPTANLDLDPHQALPADGVYTSLVRVDGLTYPSVTNIGKNPTFSALERTVEVHLLDFAGDLYCQNIRLEIIERLREERRFDDSADLKAQVAQDIQQARTKLATAAK
jgi:riboflavin kinase / FMN adenylyltransferase